MAASIVPIRAAGDARPDTLIYLFVRDVDALADEFGMTSEKHLGRTKSNCVTRTGTVYASAQRNREAHRTVSLLGVDQEWQLALGPDWTTLNFLAALRSLISSCEHFVRD